MQVDVYMRKVFVITFALIRTGLLMQETLKRSGVYVDNLLLWNIQQKTILVF